MLLRGNDEKARKEINLSAFEAVASIILAVEKAYGFLNVPDKNDNVLGFDKFGERIRYLCHKTGQTTIFIAGQLDISRTALDAWINGDAYPGYWKIIKLATHFRVTPNWLMTGEG